MKKVMIFSHYLGSLKYFDRLYDGLVARGCEVVYGFRRDDEYLEDMIRYCEKKRREYRRLD